MKPLADESDRNNIHFMKTQELVVQMMGVSWSSIQKALKESKTCFMFPRKYNKQISITLKKVLVVQYLK